ncbi:MAG: hypothetical protein LAP61_15280 [Acidobacteriia bacterium]|nr:hypothetical protein [Terriglobia bacterium]
MWRNVSHAVLLLAVACLVHAQEPSKEPPRSPEQENKQSAAVNVTALPTLSVAKELADYVLICATVLLVVVGVYQLSVMGKTVKVAQDSADAARKSADASERSSDIAQETFVNTHRPKLVVRFMQAEGIGTMSIKGQFRVYNAGATRASLKRVYAEIVVAQHLPALTPYDGKIGAVLSEVGVITGGEGKPMDFPTTPRELGVGERNAIANRLEWVKNGRPDEPDAINLFVIGWIEYLDDAKRVRKMGFCRKYNFRTKRFGRVRDEDYEYDD